MGERLMAAIAAAVLASASTGCSWIFMERAPKPGHAVETEPRCTATKGWAAWDALQATGWVALAIVAKQAETGPVDNGGGTTSVSYAPLIVGAGLFAGLHVVSGVTGVRWAERCRRARREFDQHRVPAADVIAGQVLEEERRAYTAPEHGADPAPSFYCATSSADRAAAVCAKTLAACEKQREQLVDAPACAPAAAALCFTATRVDDGAVLTACAPSDVACARLREPATLDASYSNVERCR